MGRLLLNKAMANPINTSVMTGFGIYDYSESRKEGNGVISSAVGAAGNFTLGMLLNPWVYMGATMLPGLAGVGVDAVNGLSAYSRRLQKQRRNLPFSQATFVDSQQTYTMRQAGMNLARQGQYAAAQSTMGNEAASVSYMGS